MQGKFLYALLLFFSLFAGKTFAQQDSTHALQEVRLQAFPLRQYAIGTKHLTFDSVASREGTGQTLAQTLMEQTGIYLKQYGASGIGTISFRGTGAGHTAVLWNGLPINSLTLGLTDFNALPTSATSRVTVSYGAGSALFGSGSIGGTVQLWSVLPDTVQSVHLQVFGGSFGNIGGSLAYATRKKHWAVRQHFFSQTAKNDFPFVNTAKFDKPNERQQNAEATFKGSQTELYFLPNAKNEIALHVWLQNRDAQLSPSMGENLQEHLYTQSAQGDKRFLLNWKRYLPAVQGDFELKAGYLQDLYIYNVQNSTQTQTWVGNAQMQARLRQNVQARLQTSYMFITALTQNFGETKHETRQDVSASVNWQPFERLLVALNLNQMLVNQQFVPFTPSLGLEYRAGKAWRLKGFVGKTYRVPTLNDRFWAVGGNPNLRAENGWTSEIGAEFSLQRKKWQTSFELTPYALWVQDWILWTPRNGFWSPANLQKVQARGIEAQIRATYKNAHFQLSKGLTYAFTQPQNEGKQLAYTPFHRLVVWAQASYKGFFLYQNAQLTGSRYTSLTNTDKMPFFVLWNASVGKTFKVGKQTISLQARVNNLLNTQYQNYENRVMPRRNALFTLNIYH